jgi:hypothetical protein
MADDAEHVLVDVSHQGGPRRRRGHVRERGDRCGGVADVRGRYGEDCC